MTDAYYIKREDTFVGKKLQFGETAANKFVRLAKRESGAWSRPVHETWKIDGNVNVVIRPRQPGSSFKPIVYAQAFYNGYAPGNVIYDIPTKLGNNRPQNFDGKWQGQSGG